MYAMKIGESEAPMKNIKFLSSKSPAKNKNT